MKTTNQKPLFIEVIKGKKFPVYSNKEIYKLAMLIEGTCIIGVKKAIEKYGYTEQWYYKLMKAYKEKGLEGLQDKKKGSKTNPVRTDIVNNQIIRLRFLDPIASIEVITQKLRQAGHKISVRSVWRTINKYGLQKKTLQIKSRKRKQKGGNRSTGYQTR